MNGRDAFRELERVFYDRTQGLHPKAKGRAHSRLLNEALRRLEEHDDLLFVAQFKAAMTDAGYGPF